MLEMFNNYEVVKHFPVIAVMGFFLFAFLIEIFGSKCKIVRNTLTLIATGGAFALILGLIPQVLVEGNVISS